MDSGQKEASSSTPDAAHFSYLSQTRDMAKKLNKPTDFEFIFLTKKKSVKSYKFLLQMLSPEMSKIVDDTTNGKYLVHVEGVNRTMFEHFLEFLFTGEFPKEDKMEYSVDNMLKIAELGKIFCPHDDIRLCKKLTFARLTIGNVFEIQAKSRMKNLYALEHIVTKCIKKKIYKNAESFVENQDFALLDASWLSEMLKSNELKCAEEILLKHVCRWVTARNEADNLGKQLEDIGYFARLESMDIVQLLSLFRDSGLSNGVAIKLLAYFEDWQRRMVEGMNDDLQLGNTTPPQCSMIMAPDDNPLSTSTQAETENSSAGLIDETNPHCSEVKNESEGDLGEEAAPDMALDIVEENSWEEFRSKIALNLSHYQSLIAKVKILKPLTDCGIPFAFPNLRHVKLELQIPDEDDDTPEIVQIRQNFNPKPYVFFTSETISRSGVDFDLRINGVKFLKVSWLKKELSIGFDGESSTVLIKELLPFSNNFETLILSDLNLPTIQFPCQTLTQLMLWGVVVVDEKKQLGTFLQKFENLEHLTVWMKTKPRKGAVDKSILNLQTDLISGKNLKKIALSMTQIVLPAQFDIDAVKKENVTEIYTDYCHWSQVIFLHFDKLFPNLTRIDFGSYCGRRFEERVQVATDNNRRTPKRKKPSSTTTQDLVSAASITLMLNLLKIESLEWIRIEKLDYFALPFTQKQKDDLGDFFEECGFTSKHPVNFSLEKNRETGKWLGTKFMKLNNTYQEKMREEEFKNFELKRIFKDINCYNYYNVRL